MNIRTQGATFKAIVAAAEPDDAYARISALGWRLSMNAPINELIDGPRDVLGLTIAGGLYYERARRNRGGGLPQFVSRRGYELYAFYLQEAVACLERALEIDPQCGLAAALLAGARIEAGPRERDEAEQAVLDAPRTPAFGYFNVMFYRTEKWGGSQAQMWDTARKFAGASEPATLGLIARAHGEQQLFHLFFDEAQDARGKGARYYSRREVIDELRQLSEKVLASPHPLDPENTRVADGWLAKALIEADQWGQAAKHLKRLGRHADPTIWYALPWASPRMILGWTRIQAGLMP